MFVEDGSPALSQSRFGRAAVLMDVCEEREAKGNHSVGRITGGPSLRRQDSEEQGTHAAHQQIVLVPKVSVERRTADFGAIEDLRDSNAVVGLLADERAERLVQECP